MVGILIVTHNHIGEEILKTAQTILAKKLPLVKTVSVPGDLSPDELGIYADQIKMSIDILNKGQGVLIVTDMFGATPSNLAHYFSENHKVKVISGLNLSMLIRIIHYSDQPLELLAQIGIVGGNKGITKETDL